MEDLEKLPSKGKVSRPSSGAYGEQAEVDQLKADLPSSMGSAGPGPGGGSTANVRPTPTAPGPGAGTMGGAPAPARTPSGVPPLLARPTDYPNRPVSTPYGGAQVAPAAAPTGAQQRLVTLDTIMRDPNASEEFKEWAAVVRKALIGG